jgi:transposase
MENVGRAAGQTWANAVKKTGTDPDVALKDLKAELAKRNSGY